jgi:dihydrolipoamide dehydrogenase
MSQDYGLLVMYASKETGHLLGGEIVMPRAEHIAHLMNWAIEMQMTVEQLLAMPFYHPVFEEAVESCLKGLLP